METPFVNQILVSWKSVAIHIAISMRMHAGGQVETAVSSSGTGDSASAAGVQVLSGSHDNAIATFKPTQVV